MYFIHLLFFFIFWLFLDCTQRNLYFILESNQISDNINLLLQFFHANYSC